MDKVTESGTAAPNKRRPLQAGAADLRRQRLIEQRKRASRGSTQRPGDVNKEKSDGTVHHLDVAPASKKHRPVPVAKSSRLDRTTRTESESRGEAKSSRLAKVTTGQVRERQALVQMKPISQRPALKPNGWPSVAKRPYNVPAATRVPRPQQPTASRRHVDPFSDPFVENDDGVGDTMECKVFVSWSTPAPTMTVAKNANEVADEVYEPDLDLKRGIKQGIVACDGEGALPYDLVQLIFS